AQPASPCVLVTDSFTRIMSQIETDLDHQEAEAEPTYADRLRAAMVDGDDIKNIPPPEPLVAGTLDRDTLALVYGQSGCTKTFVVLDLSLSVATGTWWHGHRVEAGEVLYVVAEGLGGIGARVQAWQTKRQVHTCSEVSWLPMAVNLMDAAKVDALVEIVRLHQFDLVVLDTFARCIVGGDENSAKDIGVAVEAAERIRRASGACVVLVHHSGKDAASGARGSSALRGAVATEIEVSHADGVTTLKQTKQREHAPAEPVRLTLVPVGESCAFEPYRGEGGLTKETVDLLAELAAIVTDDDGVSGTVWKASSGVADRSFYRWQKYLVAEGYCHKGGTKGRPLYTVSDLGKEVLGQ
ncbi:MAG: helicase RepA family protein, partial [Actinomycetota bacterium]|nr:helicase RepA family protein [Actinomycetota bacterium]